jgi:hypothetical protein
MAMLRLLGTIVALVALVSLPCLLALAVIRIDELIELTGRAARRGWRRIRRRPEPLDLQPIELLAADLRRLNRQRLGIATRSSVWFEAVQHAYDDRLRAACQALGVPEHLVGLEGVDREIERVRVEGALIDAGLVLHAPAPDQRRDHHL